ncbi:MAG: thioredoxin domain-containing protein [Lentisphaerae bacterium]|nr:thioredoxin domain-containing protein [Lentisphaerota bacterium]
MSFSCKRKSPAGKEEGAAPASAVPARPASKHPPNRLAREKSPYLLQHAHNPVDWYPWGEEAFAKARKENKPIFLSVGYSTCHWCHVMERESFENEEIAAILNEHFVAIKVDREERPDIDRIYMTFVQATTGGGGWPLNVWLTPDLKPFVGGTYFPPEDRWGSPGLKSALRQIVAAWQKDSGKIIASADDITRQLQQFAVVQADPNIKLEQALLDGGYQQLKASYEPRYGGFGPAPKFPHPVALNFLLRYHARTGAPEALDMTLFTLRQMAAGGIHDHLGGGFHRYAVDNEWFVPHFEKMLYDQAQLAGAYLEAYQNTHDEFFAAVARDIIAYVLRDLTGPDGQFFSAEDADSPLPGNPADHAEGAFYVWEHREIVEVLGREDAEVFNFHYGVQPNGNVANDPQGELRNKNILMVRRPLEETARKFARPPAQTSALLERAAVGLLATRTNRPRPHLDDKTLTAWNGLMISALARAYQVLEDSRYLAAATRAAGFIEAQLYDAKSGRLLRRHRAGQAVIAGYLEDYAFFIQALLDLYEASFNIKYLTWAMELQKKQDELFGDSSGGYFSTTGTDPDIILRLKDQYDSAEPSGNAIAALNLLRLSQMTANSAWRQKAEQALSIFGDRLHRVPQAMPQMLVAVGFHLAKPRQIIIAGAPGAPDTRALLREIHARFIPDKILLWADGGAAQETLAGFMEFIRNIKMLDGKATAYVCENYVCQLPTSDPATLGKLLERYSRGADSADAEPAPAAGKSRL